MSIWAALALAWGCLLVGFLLGTLWCSHRINQYQGVICKLYANLMQLGRDPLEDK